MTTQELERLAYVNGDPMSPIYADLDDAEIELEGLEYAIEKAHNDGYQEGLAAHDDTYQTAQIERLSNDLSEARRLYALARQTLQALLGCFADGSLKLAKDREATAKRLRAALSALPKGGAV